MISSRTSLIKASKLLAKSNSPGYFLGSRGLGWLQKQKLARMELYPSKKMLVLTQEPLESADTAVICFNFPFVSQEDATVRSRVIHLERKLDEPWVGTGRKIQDKVNLAKNANKRPMKKAKLANPDAISVNIWGSTEANTENLVVPDSESPLRDTLSSFQLFRVEDADFLLRLNPVSVKKMKLALDLIEGCPVMPSADMENPSTSLDQVTWHWFTQDGDGPTDDFSMANSVERCDSEQRIFRPKGWTYRTTAPFFVPESGDVGKRILLIADPGPDSICKAEISKGTIAERVGSYAWIKRQEQCSQLCGGNEYRFASYNILADLYLSLKGPQEELYYPYCPKKYQKPEYRYPLILKEIPGYNADVLCLQEVDNRIWMRYLKLYMKHMGYDGKLCLKGGQVNEGLVVLYRQNRFKFLNSHDVFLSDLLSDIRHPGLNQDLKDFINQSENLKSLVITRPSALQVSVIEDDTAEAIFVVANTHLHFAPSQTFVRLIQTALCTRHLESVLEHYRNEHPTKRVALIWGADLNSLTENGSVQYLLNSELPADHPEWQGVGADMGLLQGLELSHSMRLIDVCKDVPYSNFTKYEEDKGFAGRLDYLLVEKKDWEVKSVVPPPTLQELMEYTALPSAIAPSDHLAMVAQLALKDKNL